LDGSRSRFGSPTIYGLILRKLIRPRNLRELHFEVLIALTARACGPRLITSIRAGFELISECRDFELEIW
jgi:hypothetical protein